MAKFQKGVSGNPGGRPKKSAEAQIMLRDLALADIPEAYAVLRKNALDDGDTTAIVKILALAGVKTEAEAVISIEDKRPQVNPYAGVSTDELLKRAGFSSTLDAKQ